MAKRPAAIVPRSTFSAVLVTTFVVPACLGGQDPPGCGGSSVAAMGFIVDAAADAEEDASHAQDAAHRDGRPDRGLDTASRGAPDVGHDAPPESGRASSEGSSTSADAAGRDAKLDAGPDG